MNKLQVILLGAIVLLMGYMAFVKTVPTAFGSTANATNSTQKQLFIYGWNLANGTSTSIQNNTGSDVYATQLQYNCSGVGTSQTAYTGTGLASVTLKVASTYTSHVSDTASSNTAVTNTNLAVSTTIATSSATTLVASSTLSAGGSVLGTLIKAGSYVTFFTNATNTAVCNVGVQVI
jgi:hypothetical protein